MRVSFYQTGGAIRDEILGYKDRGIDYAVEIQDYSGSTDPFDLMHEAITMRGGEVTLCLRRQLSITAKFPEPILKEGRPTGARFLRTDPSHFTLCVKSGYFNPTTPPETIVLGTIYDDLATRDFTMNAMAKTEEGNIIDPHGGMQDLRARRVKCVGRADERMTYDGARLLRALRFVVTRDMVLHQEIGQLLQRPVFFMPLIVKLGVETVREELARCFAHDTLKTLTYLDMYRSFRNTLFQTAYAGSDKKLWLRPTIERAKESV